MSETVLSWLEQWWKSWPILAPLFLGWWNLRTEIKANKKSLLDMFNFQERKNDARATIPVVIEILEDLEDLQQAFIFRGRFIPGIEHRCPDIQFDDGTNENQISIAERTHQLRLIARRVLCNCRKVIFLLPENVMPETVKACKAIRDVWIEKAPGMKYAYELKISAIGSILQNECDRLGLPTDLQDKKLCDTASAEIEQLHRDLETCVEMEFPTYAGEKSSHELKRWNKIMNIFAYALRKIKAVCNFSPQYFVTRSFLFCRSLFR